MKGVAPNDDVKLKIEQMYLNLLENFSVKWSPQPSQKP